MKLKFSDGECIQEAIRAQHVINLNPAEADQRSQHWTQLAIAISLQRIANALETKSQFERLTTLTPEQIQDLAAGRSVELCPSPPPGKRRMIALDAEGYLCAREVDA